MADKLRMEFALINKERRLQHKPHKADMMLVGQVRDKVCIMIDDIADTITSAFNRVPIDQVIVYVRTNIWAQCSKIKVFEIAPIFAEAIRRVHNGESVSALFNDRTMLIV